ncbi:hypothetical protein LXL04_016165 [Taraxacum kok-saghyz]
MFPVDLYAMRPNEPGSIPTPKRLQQHQSATQFPEGVNTINGASAHLTRDRTRHPSPRNPWEGKTGVYLMHARRIEPTTSQREDECSNHPDKQSLKYNFLNVLTIVIGSQYAHGVLSARLKDANQCLPQKTFTHRGKEEVPFYPYQLEEILRYRLPRVPAHGVHVKGMSVCCRAHLRHSFCFVDFLHGTKQACGMGGSEMAGYNLPLGLKKESGSTKSKPPPSSSRRQTTESKPPPSPPQRNSYSRSSFSSNDLELAHLVRFFLLRLLLFSRKNFPIAGIGTAAATLSGVEFDCLINRDDSCFCSSYVLIPMTPTEALHKQSKTLRVLRFLGTLDVSDFKLFPSYIYCHSLHDVLGCAYLKSSKRSLRNEKKEGVKNWEKIRLKTVKKKPEIGRRVFVEMPDPNTRPYPSTVGTSRTYPDNTSATTKNLGHTPDTIE